MNFAGKTETDDWYKGSDAKLVSPPFGQIFGGLLICSKDTLSLNRMLEKILGIGDILPGLGEMH